MARVGKVKVPVEAIVTVKTETVKSEKSKTVLPELPKAREVLLLYYNSFVFSWLLPHKGKKTSSY